MNIATYLPKKLAYSPPYNIKVIFREPVSYPLQKAYERTNCMTYPQMLKNKLPFLVTLVCCVTVAALAAAVRGNDGGNAAQTSAQASPRQVIVLDAGHGAYRLAQTA